MQNSFEIKVLAGVHAGARAAAGPGRAVIGSAEDCDILLAVDDIAPHHAALTITEDGVLIVPLEGEVILADGSLVRDETPIAPFSPFGIGSAVLAHAPAGAAWPRIDLSTFGRPAPAQEAAVPAVPAAGPEIRTDMPVPAASRPAALQPRNLYPLAALLLIGIAFVGASWFRGGTGSQANASAVAAPLAPPTPVERVSARIEELGLADRLKARALGEGAVMVTGYVDSAQERREAAARLPGGDAHLSLRIWSQDELVAAARSRLGDFPDEIAVSSEGPGVLRLSGLASDGDRRSRILAAVREDVPGVRDVVDGIVTPEEGLSRLRAAVASSPLAGRVSLASEGTGAGREFVARGSLGEADLAVWRDLLGSLEPDFPGGLRIRTAFVPRSDDLPFVIRSVVTGPLPYVVTSQGRRVGEGGRLAEGFVLVGIDDEKITIRHGDQTFVQRSRE